MKKQFRRKVLKNGMTVIFEKRNLPVISVAFAAKAGGVNENVSEKGISHFIEHMLYKGTPTRNPKKIGEELEKRGGTMNGFTGDTITACWCKMPSKHLDVALEVLSDIVKNPKFDEKELEKERKVIFEEIKMHKDNPHLYVFDEIKKNLYDGTMGVNLAGTFETVGSIARKKIVEKFKQAYTPNNMILCVVGDADFNRLVRFAEKNFGKKKGKISKQEFNLKNEVRAEKRKGIDQANLVFAYHVPLSTDKKSYAARLLSTLTSEGFSSRLHNEIREKRNLAYAVVGDSSITKDFAYNLIYIGTVKENIEKIKKIILNEFEKIAKSLSEKELNQIKEQLIGQYQISMEDSQAQMINLLYYESDGNAEEFYDFEKNIRAVKLKDVKTLSKIKNYSFFALVPE